MTPRDRYDRPVRITTATVGGAVLSTYTHDDLGRMTARHGSVEATYGYDAMGHMSSVITTGMAASYTYGPDGMRVLSSVVTSEGTSTTRAFYAGGALIAEADSDGTRLSFAYGPGGLPLTLAVSRPGSATATYSYVCDAMGSVISLVDANGATAASYAYDPWGVPTAIGGSDAWLAARQPLRYRGYRFDSESGLYYLPMRYYDPGLARFLAPDPDSPSAGDPLSLNRYVYCGGDPIDGSDPSGAVTDIEAEAWQAYLSKYHYNRRAAMAATHRFRWSMNQQRAAAARRQAAAARAYYAAVAAARAAAKAAYRSFVGRLDAAFLKGWLEAPDTMTMPSTLALTEPDGVDDTLMAVGVVLDCIPLVGWGAGMAVGAIGAFKTRVQRFAYDDQRTNGDMWISVIGIVPVFGSVATAGGYGGYWAATAFGAGEWAHPVPAPRPPYPQPLLGWGN